MPMMSCFDRTAAVAFQCPGYLRIGFPRLYRSEREKARIEAAVSRLPHIVSVHANPLTGKVLVLFDETLAPQDMLTALGIERAAPAGDGPRKRRAGRRRSGPSAQRKMPRHGDGPLWYLRPPEDALAFLGSDRHSGLPAALAEERLRQGRNLLPRRPPQSDLDLFLSQFKGLPVVLLGVSAALSFLTGGIVEALAIVTVLGLNGGIGFATERRAEATIASLSELIDDTVPVLRQGRITTIASSRVVPGDLLVLAPGVHVAADARVIEANGLMLDESALTGESRFVRKNDAPLPHAVPLADRTGMVYMGTAVAAGAGFGVVIATGQDTEIGHIEALVADAEPPRTPLQRQLDELGNRLVAVSSGICAVLFLIGLLRGQGVVQMLKSSISLAIAAVPEGLPTVATTSLARGLRQMRRRQMLIRRLQAVETLGAIQAICFDKTGTLTQNRMSVVALRTLSFDHEGANGGALWENGHAAGGFGPDVVRLLRICVLSNERHARMRGRYEPVLNDSATEEALTGLAVRAGLDVAAIQEAYPLLQAELRGNGRNYMATLHAVAGTGRRVIAVKGSPDEVLELCDRVQCGEETLALSARLRAQIAEHNEAMANRQLRVLGFAYLDQATSFQADLPQRCFIWLGITGLADPVRPGMDAVIDDFHCAGIRTLMLTGDQRATAHAIGRHLRLAGEREPRVLEADHLDEKTPAGLANRVAQADIFARVSPENKLQIVRALQASGEVVAMTGDGINDGPALRTADVGIAMGRNGTNLARSAADVVLADDRLETVLRAIAQGRTITRNIEKSLHFLISSNLSEILAMLGAVSVTGISPLTPMQLLWINLLSDVLPAIALAAEPADPEIMREPPRDPNRSLVGAPELKTYAREGSFLAAGALGAYTYALLRHGAGSRASGIAFNALMLGQLLHALSCRSKHSALDLSRRGIRNEKLSLAVGGSIALQALANFLPGLRGLLGLGSGFSISDMAIVLAGAGLPFLINEGAKGGVPGGTATRPVSAANKAAARPEPIRLELAASAPVSGEGLRRRSA